MVHSFFSPAKVNLLLNVLNRRTDGFHELETVMCKLRLGDTLDITLTPGGRIQLECDDPAVPTGEANLIARAARAFFTTTGCRDGVTVSLKKRIPMAAGLGGGSSNAACVLKALNSLSGHSLALEELSQIAGSLGSDVPFFLHGDLAIATGRGEQVQDAPWPKTLDKAAAVLAKPGFGVSTPWAYQALANSSESVTRLPGKAQSLIDALETAGLEDSKEHFLNSLEPPVFRKFPLLKLIKEHFLKEGAPVALMSGSGATVFALASTREHAEHLQSSLLKEFGPTTWSAITQLGGTSSPRNAQGENSR